MDGPRPGRRNRQPEGLALSVAGAEEAALTFSVQPSGDLGAIDASISDLAFTGAQGGKVPPVKARDIQVGWLDYHITRTTMDGTVYTVAPPLLAPLAPLPLLQKSRAPSGSA